MRPVLMEFAQKNKNNFFAISVVQHLTKKMIFIAPRDESERCK